MSNTTSHPLEENCVYHIFSHAVNNNNLFYSDENYYFFLQRWQHFSKDYFETYAFCLMPNHFHFCVKTLKLLNSRDVNPTTFSKIINNFLSSYTQALNKQRGRKGTLFRGRFHRIKVTSRDYFRDLICYIHHNPIHHFGASDYSDWIFSSYNNFERKSDETILNQKTVTAVFDQVDGFFEYHERYKLSKLFIEMQNAVQKAFDSV